MIRTVSAMLLLLVCAATAAPPRVLAWDDDVAARKLALVSAGLAVEITGMHPSKRTGPLRVKTAGPVAVRALDRPPGADGKPVERACPVPEGMKRPLIILLPDEGHPTGLRTLVVEDDAAGFTWAPTASSTPHPRNSSCSSNKRR